MAKVISQVTATLPRLMEAGEYRAMRFAGGKPSLQLLKKWVDDGVVAGEQKGGMYFIDLQSELLGSTDPLLAKMIEV